MAANPDYVECLASDDGCMERVRFFQRQLLSAEDMLAEQEYFRQKLRRHNRYLHGWGVVCGLAVEPAPTREAPWRVRVSDGYALGPYGDDIFVPGPVYFDLAECGEGGSTDPCEPSVLRRGSSAAQGTVYLAIKYAECVTRPVRAMPEDCGCDMDNCQYSRIRDSFELTCLSELPPSHRPSANPPLCDLVRGGRTLPCPPCPEDPYVVLAAITLPGPSTAIREGAIMSNVRRQIFSTAVLQDQLIRCCCDDIEPQGILQVTSVNFLARDLTTVLGTVDNDSPVAALNLRPGTVFGLRISLSGAVNSASLGAGEGETPRFELEWLDDAAAIPLPGKLGLTGGDTEVVFALNRPSPNDAVAPANVRGLGGGKYKATLFGEIDSGRSLLDANNRALDGEANGFPSGNGTPGGSFILEFSVG